MLDSIFQWPIDDTKPHLGNCPVVLMGHALKNDLGMLSRNLGVRGEVFDTVVATIDTQDLSRATGYWPYGGNPIGLQTLVGMCNFQYRNAHTACNDAAMTVICGMTMVLPNENKSTEGTRSLQNVVDNVETASQGQQWDHDSETYCIRCGDWRHTHMAFKDRPCKVKVNCVH